MPQLQQMNFDGLFPEGIEFPTKQDVDVMKQLLELFGIIDREIDNIGSESVPTISSVPLVISGLLASSAPCEDDCMTIKNVK